MNNFEWQEAPKTAKLEVQEREGQYGEGDTKRVIEIEWDENLKVGIVCGDITEAPNDAVMCPTTPWLEVGGGAIENVIADRAGSSIFDDYAATYMRLLREIAGANTSTQQKLAASMLANLLGVEEQVSLEQIISESLKIVTSAEGKLAVGHGFSVLAPSGNLGQKGIRNLVLTNVTPKEGKLEVSDMSRFTESAALVASQKGLRSIVIPAVGTGFAAAFGFGLRYEESLKGFFDGVENYVQLMGNASNRLTRIDYNIYCQPTMENARSISKDLLDKAGNFTFVEE